MEHVSLSISRKLPLKRLIADAIAEIERLGYSRRSCGRYRATWEQIAEFANQNNLGDEFSEDLVAWFIEKYRVSGDELGSGEGWRRHLHLGLSEKDEDRLAEVLGDRLVHE